MRKRVSLLSENNRLLLNSILLMGNFIIALTLLILLLAYLWIEPSWAALLLLPLIILSIMALITTTLFTFSILTFRQQRPKYTPLANFFKLERLNRRLFQVNSWLLLFLLPALWVGFTL